MSIGTEIRKARLIAGYTQDELAKGIGVSRITISRWEHDKNIPSAEDLKMLSSFLDISKDDINLSNANKTEYKDQEVALSIEELRLELLSERKQKNKYIIVFSIVIVSIVLVFIALILFLFNMLEWRDPNTPEEPVRVVEYVYLDE